MVLVVVTGRGGGCHRQQQHVEFLEESDPAVRDLPTRRIAEQPRPVALDRARAAQRRRRRADSSVSAAATAPAKCGLIVERSTENAAITKLEEEVV